MSMTVYTDIEKKKSVEKIIIQKKESTTKKEIQDHNGGQ